MAICQQQDFIIFILLDLPSGSVYFCPSTHTVPLSGGGAISGNVTKSYGASISSVSDDRVMHVHTTLIAFQFCCDVYVLLERNTL